jgi:hypothetical protein
MTGLTYQRTLKLVAVECPTCFVEYGIPEQMAAQRREEAEKGSTYCPNGHCWHYLGKSLEDQLRAAEARAVHADDQRKMAERSAAALRGEVTKMRKRAGNGVCPCCNRHFANVQRHMASKHPHYRDGD